MTIPIRLLAGLSSEIPIDLVAQSIDISVDRNTSPFPTPNNYLRRFAIDTNIPSIKMSINGILVDDEGVFASGTSSQSPSQIMINCASFLSTTANSDFVSIQTIEEIQGVDGERLFHAGDTTPPYFVSTNLYQKGTTTTIDASGSGRLRTKRWTGSYSGADYGKVDTGLKWNTTKTAGTAPAFFAVEIHESGYDIADYPNTFTPLQLFNIGERIVDADNNVIGIIAETSATAIKFEANTSHGFTSGEKIFVNPKVFNEFSEFVGYAVDVSDDGTVERDSDAKWTITIESVNEAVIEQGSRVYVNSNGDQYDTFLSGLQMKLVPSYWQEDYTRNPSGIMASGDYLKYGQNETSEEFVGVSYQFSTSKGNTSVKPSVNYEFRYQTPTIPITREPHICGNTNAFRYQGQISIPIRNIQDTANPAVTMATQIEEAINRTGHLISTTTALSFTGESRVSVTGASYNNGTTITHTDNPNVKLGMAVTGSGIPSEAYVTAVNSNTQFVINEATTGGSKTGQTLNLIPNPFGVVRSGPLLVITQNYIPDKSVKHPKSVFSTRLENKFNLEVFHSNSTSSISTRKSAGDKVQDLVGMVSNASKGSDLLRGIQIPYNSLVTSSAVTGVTRNFFLTFGEIPITEKGSLANTRSATEVMQDLILASYSGTNKPDASERNIFDKFVDLVVPPDVQALAGWLVNSVQDLWVTLSTPAHGNDGGIRILPEKLHVRYDAGNNYYAFNLELMASDFVIGV